MSGPPKERKKETERDEIVSSCFERLMHRNRLKAFAYFWIVRRNYAELNEINRNCVVQKCLNLGDGRNGGVVGATSTAMSFTRRITTKLK